MSAQPSRQVVGAAGHFAVETHARDAAEVVSFVWRGRPSRDQRSDDSKIDGSNIGVMSTETSPRRQSIPHAAQPKSAGKVVTASLGNNQHRPAELHQLTQVPVNRSIATEEQNDVRLIRSRHADAPFNRFV